MKARRRKPTTTYRPTLASHAKQTPDEDSENETETESRGNPPWYPIALAAFLFVVGSVLLLSSALLSAGVVRDRVGQGAAPMFIVGSLCFIPGFYNLRTALYAWRGGYGYTYSDIPS